jgi:hypothetical protein
MEIVKPMVLAVPVEVYVWVSLVALPGKLSTAVPSPQLTVIEETVPSTSAAENVRVTRFPVRAGLGVTLAIVTVGAMSLTVSIAVLDPVPPLLVAETVIVKI